MALDDLLIGPYASYRYGGVYFVDEMRALSTRSIRIHKQNRQRSSILVQMLTNIETGLTAPKPKIGAINVIAQKEREAVQAAEYQMSCDRRSAAGYQRFIIHLVNCSVTKQTGFLARPITLTCK